MDNTKLKKLSKDQHTSVKKTVKEITVAVEKCHFQNLQLGTALFLNSQLQQYFESVGGVLLGYEDVVLDDDNNPTEIHLDIDFIHVKLKATFFIFCPKVDEYLDGYVAAKKSSSVTVAVHDYFQVTCLSPKQLQKIKLQDSVQIRVTSLAYLNGRPHMFGSVEKYGRGEKSKMTNGSQEPLLSTPTKRKSDDDEGTSTKKVKNVNFNNSGVESETEEAEPAKVNGEIQPPKTPKSKQRLELPEGFEVIDKKTEKNAWKEYRGPDGKIYRSVAQIHRALEGIPESKKSSGSGSSSASKVDLEKLQACVDDVVDNWNITEDGDLKKNKKKFYQSEGLKKLPKTDRHFVNKNTSKGKPSTSSVDDDKDEDNEKEVSFNSSVEVKNITHANATINDAENAAKKKKKKKNKNKDKTI